MTSQSPYVQLGLVDLDGVIRGKFLNREKFEQIEKDGSAFCSVLFGWDSRDELYENAYTGWHNGFPDDAVRVVSESRRLLPEEGIPFYLLEFTGEGAKYCPRNIAGRVVERASASGLSIKAGFEYELFAFRETAESAAEKNYRGLVPLTPTSGGYSVLRSGVHSEFFQGMLKLSGALETPIEGLHPEAGEGAVEYALSPSQGLEAADRAVIFKTFSKIWAQRMGIMLCYMAKPATHLPGCGGHLHVSLQAGDRALFHDPDADNSLSDSARHFIGGQQKFMPELLAMTAPTVNAFTRLTPGYWAPTAANWGFDNRTCALRVIGASPKSLRSEYRVTSADANPYLVYAAALASGLAGIEQKIEPTPPVTGNAYREVPDPAFALPRSLGGAAERFRASAMARDWFGADFVEHFALSREFEDTQFRRDVSDWEMRRYFEMI